MAALTVLVGAAAAVKPEMHIAVVESLDPCRGLRVKKGDTVHITHTGYLEDESGSRRQIDSNCPPDAAACEPLAFEVGAKRILRGMERAVVGICEGETIEAEIPPHLAYDDPARMIEPEKRPVPEGSWVIYDIKIERIEREGEGASGKELLNSIDWIQVGRIAGTAACLALFALWRFTRGPGSKPKRKKKK